MSLCYVMINFLTSIIQSRADREEEKRVDATSTVNLKLSHTSRWGRGRFMNRLGDTLIRFAAWRFVECSIDFLFERKILVRFLLPPPFNSFHSRDVPLFSATFCFGVQLTHIFSLNHIRYSKLAHFLALLFSFFTFL